MAAIRLTAAQVAEIQQLYTVLDQYGARVWTIDRLAVRYGCSVAPVRNALKGYGAYAAKAVPAAETIPEWQREAIQQMGGVGE